MIKMCYLGINSCTLKFVGLDIALQELGEHAPRPAQLRECCRLSIGQTNCWQCWEILKVLDPLGYKILVLENPPNKHTKSGQKMFTPNWWEVCVFMWCPYSNSGKLAGTVVLFWMMLPSPREHWNIPRMRWFDEEHRLCQILFFPA